MILIRSRGSLMLVENHSSMEELKYSFFYWGLLLNSQETFFDVKIKKIFLMSSTKFPTWFFWFVLFSLWIFPEVQQSSTWPLTQIRNISIHPNMLHIRLENFQLQSVFTRLHGDLISRSRRNGRRTRAELKLELTGVEAEVAALQSGRIFTAREEQRAAVEGVFFFLRWTTCFRLTLDRLWQGFN